MDITARQDEIKLLNKIYKSNKPELLAVYGRRRVGKTYLIRSFFEKKNCIFFSVTGTKQGLMGDQIFNFTQRIGEIFLKGITPQVRKDWSQTFQLLNDLIGDVPKNKKVVLFFDELPWLATRKSKLLETTDYYWNQYWSRETRIKLIVCGSSASWIINKVINNKGGLYNRVTETIHLKPFNLYDMRQYLRSNHIELNVNQLTELYMITGGIPFYLDKIERGQSATQAIESLAFDNKSLLFNEFDNLFASLFDDSEAYTEIVKSISKHREGIGQEDLFKSLKKTAKGQNGLKRLKDLEESGFIISFKPHFHLRRGLYYRIADEYSLFYLYWLEPLKSTKMSSALKRGYWKTITQTPKWFSWSGYAFESLCYKHLNQIRDALNLPLTATPNSWRYSPAKNTNDDGAQIDSSASSVIAGGTWSGWYLQSSYYFLPTKLEGVVRYGQYHAPDQTVDFDQWAVGLDYWFSPNLSISDIKSALDYMIAAFKKK